MLAELGDEARVLAGGQSLVPMLNLRLARPSALVDVGRVDALSGISANGDAAARRHDPPGRCAALAAGRRARAAAERGTAARRPSGDAQPRHARREHRPRRSGGRAAGRAARARRRGDRPLSARASARSRPPRSSSGRSRRRSPTGELLTALRLPDPPAGARHGFAEIARRRGDFALAGAAVVVAPGYARVALFGVAPSRLPRRGRGARARAGRRSGGGGASSRPPRPSRPAIRTRPAAYRAKAARVATLRALLAAGVARG